MATASPSFLPRFLFLCFILSFLLFFLCSSHFSSHPLSFSPYFLLYLCISLLLFGALTVWVKRRKCPPLLPQAKCVAIHFLFIFFYFIIPLYDIITYMAQCEPFLFIPSVILLRCHVASPNLAMCHPTSHASKNMKSGPPRNPTKFDVVTKFRETISMDKSVSSSEI